MQSCKKQINLGYRDVSMIWLGTHVTRAVVSGHAAALNGNKFRGCQPETVRKWVAEMSTNALSHNLELAHKERSQPPAGAMVYRASKNHECNNEISRE